MELKTKNFTIEIFEGGDRGYFEHNDLGDGCGGELLINDANEIYDYDGVFALPKEVAACLRNNGYVVTWDCVEGEVEE